MSVYLVTYDLRMPGRNYNDLYAALDKYANCHDLESVWFIDTENSSSAIRDHLEKFIDSNDGLFVGKLTQQWSGYGIRCANWLNDSSRSW